LQVVVMGGGGLLVYRVVRRAQCYGVSCGCVSVDRGHGMVGCAGNLDRSCTYLILDILPDTIVFLRSPNVIVDFASLETSRLSSVSSRLS